MSGKDFYYNKAKQEGYRARSAYKLKQLDDAENLLSRGDAVVDLGAAPGGWLQVAAEAVGEGGTVVGVDRQRIDPLEATHGADVEYVRGDVTEESTREEVIEVAGRADAVLSDMAPNVTGEYNLDHARSVHLARQAFETAEALLGPGGDFAVKVFEGPDVDDLAADVEESFEYVRRMQPDATREESSELYLVGKGFLTAPVEVGEELTVAVEAVGDEGDGIAEVEGFTVFVPDAESGDEVEVRIEAVKPRYAFAERCD
ncbi:23S rRNA (uridine(2552)-2'-O)-methyltransferase [Halobacteriales archaeon QS_1_68_20]|nr:MAG: 23S rRNA (uridine(2552)-2'-O)-methyltransferase [Halobacteriales archaeon QS_1_68_20]